MKINSDSIPSPLLFQLRFVSSYIVGGCLVPMIIKSTAQRIHPGHPSNKGILWANHAKPLPSMFSPESTRASVPTPKTINNNIITKDI